MGSLYRSGPLEEVAREQAVVERRSGSSAGEVAVKIWGEYTFFGGQKSKGPRKGTEEYQQLTDFLYIRESYQQLQWPVALLEGVRVCVERACRGEISLMNDY